MAKLIIIGGASGAGKTFVLSQLQKYRDDVITIKKYTTRGPRKGEPQDETIDLRLNQLPQVVRNCKYSYPYGGHSYGIKKQEIDSVLKKGKSPVVVVASCDTISKLKEDYPNALSIYMCSGFSGKDLEEHLLKYNDPVDVEERMKRHRNSYIDYVQHFPNKLFDFFLQNYYDETFIQQFESLLNAELLASPNPQFAFVIMSFKPEYNKVYEAMKTGGKLTRRKIEIQRVSEQPGDYIITSRIEDSINNAGIIICDVSELSPNVYYELGFARAQKKTIIMTARTGTSLPFDVRQYRTNFYSDEIELQEIIKKELLHYFSTKH